MYYLSKDMNLQPGSLRGQVYTVLNKKVHKLFLSLDYEERELQMQDLSKKPVINIIETDK